MNITRFFSVLLLLALTLPDGSLVSARPVNACQVDSPEVLASQLLEIMSPQERVGQLFLVSFSGSTADTESQIYDLIVRRHVGGVMLMAGNDNFVEGGTALSAYQLISQLQQAEWQASQRPAPNAGSTPTPSSAVTPMPGNYIPLFIGISQGGDGYPNDQILAGITQLPSIMAVGATWDPTLAEQVGMVAGQELSALGFNLFIGPTLDVLKSPETTLGNGLNADVFGGDPYWVGKLGSAYISGLHKGSRGRMLVIPSHFPGGGSADRPAGQEPATVRKGLEELKKIELAPFVTVTGNTQLAQSTADGLLVSHIRYQGFQGNIRSTTRPVSFDPQALSQILSLPAFSKWRTAGGLLVSDNLGSPTVRSFYDPGRQSFSAKLVARDAFLAGNDLLYMGNITSSDSSDNYSTVLQTLDFFVQKYNEDSAFKKSVDSAVLRILTLKYRLYNYFSPSLVIPQEAGLALLDQSQSQAVTSEVARQSATLISPDNILELETVLPAPPGMRDQLVFLTDTRSEMQCSSCTETPMLAVDTLQNEVLRLYGPKAGGQIVSGRMISFTFDSLGAILPGGTGNVSLEGSLRQATWVIINMLEAEPGQTQTTLLRRFLSERQDLIRNKNVIVFAFNAPYFLDATDISKLTAYYGLYGKSEPFVEVAARLLFRELTPTGILPVSVSGVGYDLLTATSPDPNQVILLYWDLPSSTSSGAGSGTPEPTFTPSFTAGETILVRTGVIVDRNGHPVPDGTGVKFTVQVSGSGGIVQEINATTTQGVASAPFNIGQAGLLDIRASSEPAMTSNVLQLNVSNGILSVTNATPTAVIVEPTVTPTLAVTPIPIEPPAEEKNYPGFGGWMAMVILLGGLGYLAYWLGEKIATRHWGMRWSICVILGGLFTYTYLAVRLPGAATYLQANGWLGIMGVVFIGAVVGAGIAYLWFARVRGSEKR